MQADLRVLDDLPNCSWAHDAKGRTYFLNERYRRFTGITQTGLDWLEPAHPEDRALCVAQWTGARAVGQSFEIEIRMRRADGAYRWHLVRVQRARPIEHAPPLWLADATDIEETHHAQDLLEYINAASRLLSASLDTPATINELLDLVTPRFADCAMVDTFDEDGAFVERYIRGDQQVVSLLQRELDLRLAFGARRTGAWSVLDTGRPRLQSFKDTAHLRALAYNDEHAALLNQLAPRSVLALPLRVGGRTVGVVTLVATMPGREFGERDLGFFQDLAARTSVAIGNAEAYVREHRIATRLQRAMLPERLPQLDGMRLDAAYLPSDEELLIGGDWYDAFMLPGDRVAISIGDVAGHGLEAAITMSQLRHALRVAALEVEEPGAVLTAANRALVLGDDLKLATACFAVVDRRTLRMTYANAGHPPPVVVDKEGNSLRISYGELPLGIDPDGTYDTHYIALAPGMLAVFYTDGLIENQHDLQRGAHQLYEAILIERDAARARLGRRIVSRVLSSANTDDIAILTLELEAIPLALRNDIGNVRWAFQADDASAAHDARNALLTYLRARGTQDSDFSAAELIFGELVGNVVKHAPGPITIELIWDGETPTLRVGDRGPGFDLRPALPEDLMSECGRGLFLASAFATDLRVTRVPEGGSRVCATLPVRRL